MVSENPSQQRCRIIRGIAPNVIWDNIIYNMIPTFRFGTIVFRSNIFRIGNYFPVFIKNNFLTCDFMIIFFIANLPLATMIPIFIRLGFIKTTIGTHKSRLPRKGTAR